MKKCLMVLLALLLIVSLYNCGGGSGGGSLVAPQSYAGPGSRWRMELHDDGTFDTSELDSGLEVSGSWTTTTSGFKELTVTATNDSGAVALDSKGYGLEIPGVVFLLKPFAGDQIISMVEAGQCPDGDVTANWVMTNKNVDVATSDVVGTFSYTHGTTSATLPARYALDRTPAGSQNLGALTCTDGVANVADGIMYLTQIGGAIVHTNAGTPADKTDDNFIVALPADPVAAIGDLDDTYVGLVFAGSSGGDSLFPVEVTLNNGDGTGTGAEILDHDTGALSGSTVNVAVNASINDPSDGFIYGTIDGANFVAMANVNVNGSGKNFIFLIGENPGEAGELYNMLLISK